MQSYIVGKMTLSHMRIQSQHRIGSNGKPVVLIHDSLYKGSLVELVEKLCMLHNLKGCNGWGTGA